MIDSGSWCAQPGTHNRAGSVVCHKAVDRAELIAHERKAGQDIGAVANVIKVQWREEGL